MTTWMAGAEEARIKKEELRNKLRVIVKEKGLKIEDMVYIVEYIEDYKDNSEALEVLLSGDLIKKPEDGKCYFFTDNIANIIQIEETGHYVYRSRNLKTGETFYLNVIDFFIIVGNKKNGEIITDLLTAFALETEEEKRKKEQREKYINNIQILEKEAPVWALEYPVLYKLIKPTISTLQIINTIGLSNVVGDKETVGKDAVFFSSYKYIGKKAKLSKSTVIKHVSLLTLLGFIEKIEIKQIPMHLLERAEKEASRGKELSLTNFYIVKAITPELLEKAEQIAIQADQGGIRAGTITMPLVAEVFGKEFTDKIYGNNKILIKSIVETKNKKKEEKQEEKREKEEKKEEYEEEEITEKLPF